MSRPNTAQPVFIKVSALALSVTNTDWMERCYILFIFPRLQVDAELGPTADVLPARVAATVPFKLSPPSWITRNRCCLPSLSHMKATAPMWLIIKPRVMISSFSRRDTMRNNRTFSTIHFWPTDLKSSSGINYIPEPIALPCPGSSLCSDVVLKYLAPRVLEAV